MGNNSGGRFRKLGFRNRTVVSVFISIMLAYSAKKNMANGPAAYSTLNPETSSDSPSVGFSKGRDVSYYCEGSCGKNEVDGFLGDGQGA